MQNNVEKRRNCSLGAISPLFHIILPKQKQTKQKKGENMVMVIAVGLQSYGKF